MAVVFIPPPLRELTKGQSQVTVDGANVAEVIASLDRGFPGIGIRLRHGDSLAPGLQVSVDDVITVRGIHTPVNPDSELHFLPAIGGGGSPARRTPL